MTNPDKIVYNTYMELFKKYLQEAEKLYKEGDLSQAGEKYYGAVAELLKMIGEKRGWEHKGHILRREIIRKLNNEYPELNLWFLYKSVETLHQNFYENDLTKEMFDEDKKATETLISHLKEILEKS
ncbi:MAG: PaREP1 family protein [candidate division WOR-3 bacterium]